MESDKLTSEAKVLEFLDEGTIILDETIFYPQGGGQPYDQGFIESPSGKFKVEEVRFVDGIVRHIGSFESGSFKPGDKVTLNVNKERRLLNSKIHSAGHLVDLAVNALKLDWIPGKGFHFPEGPYVEYIGSLGNRDKEELKEKIEKLCNEFIQEHIKITSSFMDKENMKQVCSYIPEYIPEGKPTRVVMFGEFGFPCGGTHINNLEEIEAITIPKIKTKGETIRVSYRL